MPSIVHSDGWRSLSRSSAVVNSRQRRYLHCFRAPLTTSLRTLPSARAFPPTHNRRLVNASFGWRWLFLRHDLIQLRGLRIRKISALSRDEKPASLRFREFTGLPIEPIPGAKEKSGEEKERKTALSLPRAPLSKIRDGPIHVARRRWAHNREKLVKPGETSSGTEEYGDRKHTRDKGPRIRKVAAAYGRSSRAYASRMGHFALKEEQGSITAGILLSEEPGLPERDKQSEELILSTTRDSKIPVDGQEDRVVSATMKAGLITTTPQLEPPPLKFVPPSENQASGPQVDETNSEWQRLSLPAQNSQGAYQTTLTSSDPTAGAAHQLGPSEDNSRLGSSQAGTSAKVPFISLRAITAKFMSDGLVSDTGEPWKAFSMNKTERVDKAKLAILSPAEQVYLTRSGYTIQDVKFWAGVLSEEDTCRAARTIFENVTASSSESADIMTDYKPVPSFVLHSFLCKNRLPAGALRLLLIAVWHHMNRLTRERYANTQAESKLAITESRTDELAFALFVRLLQHARKVMPAYIVNVAAVVSTYLSWLSSQEVLPPSFNTAHGRLARLTALYNRTLALLSKPTPLNPMKSSALQERAQFDVLARMVNHRPPIDLNREGWRAIIAVLLRRQKTKEEQKWAELKSLSWPPFKESRIGSDEQLTPDDGISRAHQAIRRMQEAGYSTTNWERVATILSGWDTDGSPTVQTRRLISPLSNPSPADIWAARITATRTLHEAWACFLSQDQEGGRPEAPMYAAMFEKIIFEHLRMQRQADNVLIDAGSRSAALPGDGKEVSAPPVSPAEAVYTRSQPPSFEAFFDRMLSDGIEPRGRLLALLLNHAPNVIMGYKVINSCAKAYNGIIPKLVSVPLVSKEELEAASIPSHVLAALIRFLCLAKDDAETEGLNIRNGDPVIVPDWITHTAKRTVHAFHLLRRLQPRYRPAWNHVLDGLSRLGLAKYLVFAQHRKLGHFNHVLASIMARQVIVHMKSIQLELDTTGFYHLCICMEKAALSARAMVDAEESVSSKGNVQVRSRDERVQSSWFGPRRGIAQPLEEAKSLLASGSQYLRTTFQELVGTASKEASSPLPVPDAPPLPKLLATPNPAQLHAYVRALGVLQDHEGILSLAQWMHTHHDELYKSAVEELGGQRRLRSVFVAMRVFLEQPSEDGMVKNVGVDLDPASPELVELVAREIRAVQEWGDWPSNKRVQAYLWTCTQKNRKM